MGVNNIDEISLILVWGEMIDMIHINNKKYQMGINTCREVLREVLLRMFLQAEWQKKVSHSKVWVGKAYFRWGNSCVQSLLKQGVGDIPGTQKTKVVGVWKVGRIIWDEVGEGARVQVMSESQGKKLGFYFRYSVKRMKVFKQRSDKIWLTILFLKEMKNGFWPAWIYKDI